MTRLLAIAVLLSGCGLASSGSDEMPPLSAPSATTEPSHPAGGAASTPTTRPRPDLTANDPARAVEEIYRFYAWVLEHAPRAPWASVPAFADSPAYWNLRILYETFEFSTLRYTSDEGFAATGIATVPPSDERVPPAVAADVPDGGVFVVYETSSGLYERVTSGGTVYEAYEPFDLQLVVGVAPTPCGGKLFWEKM